MKDFSDKIDKIRQRAREKMEDGAVTSTYGADKEKVLELLNEALATEIVCVLRYKFHYEAAKGIESSPVKEEFLEHANDEQKHVDWIATRISQLGGTPDYDPSTLSHRAHTDYVEGETLKEMLNEDLVAERIVIGVYQEFIRYLGNDDPTTRKILEHILADEEEHADDLNNLLTSMPERSNEERPNKREGSYQKYQRSVA